MAKRPVSGARAGGAGAKSTGSRGFRIVAVLVGFVLLAVGVTMRRVYGFGQAKQIREMEQRREALISEQLKLQDAIRVASDRAHLIDLAQTRLNMRLPAPNQVIYLPRRPLGAGRDSSRP
jgi:cell division protein FtsL